MRCRSRCLAALLLLLVLPLASGCGDDPARKSGEAEDMAAAPADLRGVPGADLAGATDAAIDLAAVTDLVAAVDLAGGRVDLAGPPRCVADRDCRLYSSPCKNPMPCLCLPLRVDEPNPTCIGPMVLCDIDPCDGKTAFCDGKTGQCAAR